MKGISLEAKEMGMALFIVESDKIRMFFIAME
jgi:hypothetical protein